jgi:hypothetical protein
MDQLAIQRRNPRKNAMVDVSALIRLGLRAAIAVTIALGAVPMTPDAPALAGDVNVGGVALKLPPPSNYCDLDTTNPSDSRLLGAINGMLNGSGNRLLAGSADCTELSDWRTGKRKLLDNLAQYQTLISQENVDLSATGADIVKTACAEMRTQGEQTLAAMAPDIKTRAETVMKAIEINEQRFLGVVEEEPGICYAALLQKFKAETGDDKTQVTVFATTILGSKLVYIYLFAPYRDGAAVADLLAQQKKLTADLQALNTK